MCTFTVIVLNLNISIFSVTLNFHSATSWRQILHFLLHYINLITLKKKNLKSDDHNGQADHWSTQNTAYTFMLLNV